MTQLLTPTFPDYELIDSGDFEKLERFGAYITRRPEPQAIWHKSLPENKWRELAHASFMRTSSSKSDERGEWQRKAGMPDRWTMEYRYKGMHLTMRLGLTSFKHVGILHEQEANWTFIYDRIEALKADGTTPKVLNLFAYTGGATLAAKAAGADVTHVDSVKQVVTWSRENMERSGLEGVRWIVED
ncbi:MAG: class I SAM-dependent methyltransferase, partial [Alistipes sp.]|nr:class I SAM-dependent methyltransferase [Alistipes sp.]